MIMKLTNPARMFNDVFYPCNPSIHPKAYSKYVDKHVNHMAYKRLAQKSEIVSVIQNANAWRTNYNY